MEFYIYSIQTNKKRFQEKKCRKNELMDWALKMKRPSEIDSVFRCANSKKSGWVTSELKFVFFFSRLASSLAESNKKKTHDTPPSISINSDVDFDEKKRRGESKPILKFKCWI